MGKLSLTDEEWIQQFQTGDSFRVIGRRLKVSGQYVGNVYKARFLKQFPEYRSGRERSSGEALAQAITRFSKHLKPPASLVIAEAQRWNLTALPLVRYYESAQTYQRLDTYAEIAGKVCHIRHCKVTRPAYAGAEHDFFSFQFRKTVELEGEFIIFCCGTKPIRFYICPRVQIEKASPNRNYYIPVDDISPYHNLHSRIHWRGYRDAWYLIDPQASRNPI